MIKTTKSAWGYEQRGENRFGRPGVYFDATEAAAMIRADQDAFLLLALLKAKNRPGRTFWIANGWASQLGWTRKRFAAARRRLLNKGTVRMLTRALKASPANYCWGEARVGEEGVC